MKRFAKNIVVKVLGWQVRRLRRKNQLQIVAVTGSVGKTSTKLAIARFLGEHYKVRSQEGNYNDIVSVPLVFFGANLPNLLNPVAWLKIFIDNEFQIMRTYPFDYVVLELGTDGPGQLKKFKKYLDIDILIVTSVAPEHMEFFKTLDAVAEEELQPQTFSKLVLINTDLCPSQYAQMFKANHLTYGIKSSADYTLKILKFDGQEFSLSVYKHDQLILNAQYRSISEVELYSVNAAVAVAEITSVPIAYIKSGLGKHTAFSGRMRQLQGVNQSLIIDDTYNASPDATKAALDTLYSLKSSQKIALLGNMNELGSYSQIAHTEVGEYCNPTELSLVVTIGRDANRYLATAAKKRGCVVKTFDNPYSAGLFIKEYIKPHALILAKGSQNGVFAEEAVKFFLANPQDKQLLVRQSPQWLHKKKKLFQMANNT